MGARLLTTLLLGAALALGAAPAAAYCRSTTCTGDCPRDDAGCKTTGEPLAWPGLCVGFSLQRDGTANIEMDDVRRVVEASFAEWSDRSCDGGEAMASIGFAELDDVTCHASEYNKGGANANIILFQDNRWKYHGEFDTLAKTTVTFDNDTGEILDADLEINHAYNEFTVGEDNVVYDLQSVVTHEIGHFIGLDHTLDYDATMNAGYIDGTIDLRTIEADDIAALCAAYPPGRPGTCDPKPRGGLADACGQVHEDDGTDGGGCATAPRPGGGAVPLGLLALALVLRRVRARGARPGRVVGAGPRAAASRHTLKRS